MHTRIALSPRPLLGLLGLLGLLVALPGVLTSCKRDDAAGTAAPRTDAAAAVPAGFASALADVPPTAAAPTGATGPSFEGVLTMHITDAKHPPQDLTIMTKANKIRFDMPGKDGEMAHSIFDPATSQATVIIDSRKMAMKMAMPKPPATPTEAPVVTKTGKHDKVAGRDCEVWDVVEAGGKRESVCVSEGMSFFDFGALVPPGSGGPSFGSWLSDMREKKEFPLRSITVDPAGKETARMEVSKIEAKSLDNAMFEVPAGYSTMDMGKMAMPGAPPPMSPHPR